MTPNRWKKDFNAIGIIPSSGKYSLGTFAHPDIAFEFASWLNVEFKLYLITEFERLKKNEAYQSKIEWSVKRELSKTNYVIHTDSIKEFIVPTLTEKQKQFISDIHRLGAEVLMSSHTFRFMSKERAFEYINEQHSRGADIAKLVSAANDDYELAENMSISAELSKDNHLPALFLCVGDFCKRHRITAPLICGGMFLCVIEHDELATPVQPLLSDAKAAVELVYGE